MSAQGPKLTKGDLRVMAEHLASLRPPGPRPLTAEQLVRLDEVIAKVHGLIEIARAAPERGELVFEWRVPKEWALTLNVYAQKKGWQKKKLGEAMDDALRTLLPQFPKALLHGSQQRRWLRATRFSTKVVDDVSVDVVGGKMATDALVRAGILADDDAKHLVREARSAKTKPGNTHLLVQIYEVVDEGRGTPEPTHARIQQLERAPGPMTQMILGAR